MTTEYKIIETQRILRRAFDAEKNYREAKTIIDIAKSIMVDGHKLNHGFIATMEDDI
jgi:hypothetical protein